MKKISLIIMFILVICIPNISSAGLIDEGILEGNGFVSSAMQSSLSLNNSIIIEKFQDVFNILTYVGIALSVIVGAILGIQIMISSADEKAKVKESLIPYIIGCIVVFGAFSIWQIVITIFNAI